MAAEQLVGGLLGRLKGVGGGILKYVEGARLSAGLSKGQGIAMGWLAGAGMGVGGPAGALGAAAIVSPRTRQAVQKASRSAYRGIIRPAAHHPGLALFAGTAAAGLTGMMVGGIRVQPDAGIGPAMAGPGYASWVGGRSGGMSPSHLGATGGLALALHQTRHRLPSALRSS